MTSRSVPHLVAPETMWKISVVSVESAARELAIRGGQWGFVGSPNRHVIDFYAVFSEEFLEIPVGEPERQIPAHRQENHFGREPEDSERRQTWRRWRSVTMPFHFETLAVTNAISQATVPPRAIQTL